MVFGSSVGAAGEVHLVIQLKVVECWSNCVVVTY